jgi:dephospho-CoA kinase
MKKIVGICGLIGHGKDTAAGFLIEQGYQRISFAGVLKDATAALFGWDRILLEGNTPESRVFREQVDEWWANRLDIPNFTPRLALQQIGTDALRKHFHPDIWVAACERQIEMTDKNVVISDCRFFNELDVIKRLGGTTVVVWRHEKPLWWATASNINESKTNNEPNNAMQTVFPEVHPSEWSWAGWNFDIQINNDSDLDSLRDQVIQNIN